MIKKILSHLGAGHNWAGSVRYYPVIDSTNTEAKQLAEQGAPHGTVLIAEQQTNGRGRMGNRFHSPGDGGIYLSIILRPACKASQLNHLTCAVATAVCDAIEEAATFRPGVKWINDLVYNGRKLGGILTELSVSASGDVGYAVIGIGINCNQDLSAFPAELQSIVTSISDIAEQKVDRSQLIAGIISHLDSMFINLISGKSALMDRYRKDCITIDQDVVILKGAEKHYGKALSILDDGALQVQYIDGHIGIVNSGEVHVRGLYGYC